MRQYLAFKKKHRDAVVLFRMGDFYEMFFDDAKTAARVLGLALTSREKGENAVPMAGFPHHAADTYIKRLIEAGYQVAVCDQVQDPREARGLVERDVTRIITAGTLTEENILDRGSNNYLAAVVGGEAGFGVAWADLSTGKFEVEDVPAEALGDTLRRISPAECLLPESEGLGAGDDHPALGHLPERCVITRRPAWEFSQQEARRRLNEHFHTGSLDGFGCEEMGHAIGAAGAVLAYLEETQRRRLDHITRIEPFISSRYLVLDRTTQRSLELVETMRTGEQEGSLQGVLNRTETPLGARLLRRWILTPLKSKPEIEARLDAVGELVSSGSLRDAISERLRTIYDIERLTSKIVCARANARDVVALRNSLEPVPAIKGTLAGARSELLRDLQGRLDEVPEAVALIASAIHADPPALLTEGGIIRDGYSPELDELRQVAREGKSWIAAFEAEEVKRAGIPSLKVGFNKVFGYYIEVTNTHKDKVPEHYIRKQTLKNAERYITPQLKEWESRVLTAGERVRDLEQEIFHQVRAEVSSYAARFQQTAEAVAELDVLLSLATVAAHHAYVRPAITEGTELCIEDGRHPVLEQIMQERFVPNSVEMDGQDVRVLIITGPNMAGKSVYIRQCALLVLMAQMGSFIPAKKATIGIVDRIFTRVGASDEQRRGLSTFMVEMIEAANILNNATGRSLIILDEVGRGTSTFDGVSIAWATAEYIHNRIGARTLFATHYHEIAQLADTLSAVRNLNVAVREWQGEVIFLHRIVPGHTDQSYGVHVAKLAGVPREVVDRARGILSHLEEHSVSPNDSRASAAERGRAPRPKQVQMPLFRPLDTEVREELLRLDISSLTPLEALQKLEEIRRRLSDERS